MYDYRMEWLTERLREIGRKPIELARHLGLPPARVYEMQRGQRRLKTSEIPATAAFLGWPVDLLLAAMNGRAAPGGGRAAGEPREARRGGLAEPPRQPMIAVPFAAGRPDLPIWASAEAGDDGAIVITPDPIDYIHRPGHMASVRDPYGFIVVGSSMSPALEDGDLVIVNPVLRPRAGADCVFIHDQPDGAMKALVKRLVRPTADSWKVRQFSPPRDFDLSRRKWPRAAVISDIRRGGL